MKVDELLLARIRNNDPSLKTLDLRCIKIEIATAYAFAQALKENCTLTTFHLDCNKLDEEGDNAIIEVLKENTTLLNFSMMCDFKSSAKIKHYQKRNKKYAGLHQQIESALNEINNTFHLGQNLEEVHARLTELQKDCNYLLRYNYAHADKLLHKLYSTIALLYQRTQSHDEFIKLYHDYFVSHPDDNISLMLADIIIADNQSPSETYEINQSKWIFILLALQSNHTTHAQTIVSRCYHALKNKANKLSCEANLPQPTQDEVITLIIERKKEVEEKTRLSPARLMTMQGIHQEGRKRKMTDETQPSNRKAQKT